MSLDRGCSPPREGNRLLELAEWSSLADLSSQVPEESVIVVDQAPSKLSRSVKANAGCKISFALGHAADLSEMAQSMGLESEEDFHLLRVGQAVVTMPHRRLLPVQVAFPRFRNA